MYARIRACVERRISINSIINTEFMNRSNKVLRNVECDICIVGAGSAGMAAAYALKDTTHKVVVVDDNRMFGGTAVNGWVQTWIEGINPPYLEKILRRLGVSEADIKNSVLPPKVRRDKGQTKSGNLSIPALKLANIYKEDMDEASNIESLLGYTINSIHAKHQLGDGKWQVDEIFVSDLDTDNGIVIKANYFIDSTGDGVLCRLVSPHEGVDYFVGEDPYSRFKESLMPKASSDGTEKYDPKLLNEPSLFYEVQPMAADDEAILKEIKTVEVVEGQIIAPDYLTTDGYANRLLLNPMTGLGITGYDVLQSSDKKQFFQAVKKRHIEHWKYVKLSLIKNFNPSKHQETDFMRGYSYEQRKWNYTGRYAPMLGIRESYRINCDYMLRQDDLTKLIDSADLGRSIACGSHIIDFHVWRTIDREQVSYFNKYKIVPSGIPYDCLLPLSLNNVIVACRAFGASHIALAARRVNKDMAQLGWAAGLAIKQCLEKTLSGIRQVDVAQIQRESGFVENVKLLENIYIQD